MGRLLALLGALIAGAWIAWTAERLPDPASADAPKARFSAERAMADIRLLAPAPHPIGSPQNKRVRDALVGRMTALGLSPQVRPGVGVLQPHSAPDLVIAGPVENVVGVLPGRDRDAPAVALMAHYDSVPGSPGAADDIMGVASALEIIRAVKARGTPARDVMLVITDGEEAGLLGANHFFRRDPLAKRIGLSINLEARGAGGRAQMFQTSPDNGELIALFRDSARRPASSSLAVLVYQRMPNDTDLTETLRSGVPGFNFAIVGKQFEYHSPTATPENLDRGSLQDMGDQVLALTAEAAFGPALPAEAEPVVYSNLFGDAVLAYPPWIGWIVLAAIAVLLVFAVRRAREIEAFPVVDMLHGAGALLFAVVGSVALLQFARRFTGVEFGYLEQRALLAQVGRWEWAVMLVGLGTVLVAAAELARGRRVLALLPVLAGVGCSLFGGVDLIGAIAGVVAGFIVLAAYGRPVSRRAGWAGVLTLGLVLAAAAQAAAPTAAYVLAWPLLAGAIGAAATALGARKTGLHLLVLAGLAAVTLGWVGGLAHAAFLSLDLMPLQGLPVLLAAFVLWPLAQPADGAAPTRLLGVLMLLVGLGVSASVRAGEPWTGRHPKVSYVGYQLDQESGKSWRFGPARGRTAWSDAVLSADGGKIARRDHWSWRQPMVAAPAQPIAEPAPTIELARTAGGDLRLTAETPPGARTLALRLRATSPARVNSVNGVPVNMALPAGKWVKVQWQAPGTGLQLTVKPAAAGRLDVRYTAGFDRWPAAAKPLPPRPATLMAWDNSDSTFVSGARVFMW